MPSKTLKQHNLMEMVAHNPAKAKELKIPQSVGKDFVAADKGKKFKAGGKVMHDDIAEDKKLIKRAFGMHDKQLHESKKTDLSKLKQGGKVMKMKETMGPKNMSKDVEKGSNKLGKFGESKVQKRGHTKGSEERGYKTEKVQGGAKGGKGIFGAAPIKMKKGGKVKRYDEGGDIETETAQGQNKNIGDDVRSRAMAAMSNREMDVGGGGSTGSTAKKSAPSFKAKATKAGFTSGETGGGAALMYRKDRKMAKGGVTRADGIASKGKTRGKMC